ncbi:hypothetical protein AG1IA_07555 [Rhizoctonia solani AG-1 IA]|uniref:Uncharacterized protein n=1 Tax=Thanatephorus cucumeris (strain AG1-IA) TaxID=983506 RepID=L8WKG1_THACA|nr:hypothetical protein AG1IA_07555 [Rhizoctonia solani AG-1 IA]
MCNLPYSVVTTLMHMCHWHVIMMSSGGSGYMSPKSHPENQYISKRFLFSVGHGLKTTMLICLHQHESEYGRIDT